MTRKHDKTGRSKGQIRDFIALERYILKSPAWRSLDAVARAAYIEIAMAYNGSNNGRIVMSARMLADGLNVSKDTAARKIHILQERGFIERVKQASFSMKVRHAAEYRLTAFPCNVSGALASKTFMRGQPEIQNTVRPRGPNGTATGTEGAKRGMKQGLPVPHI